MKKHETKGGFAQFQGLNGFQFSGSYDHALWTWNSSTEDLNKIQKLSQNNPSNGILVNVLGPAGYNICYVYFITFH